jgi:Zn-dependent peptidase ImmA (M78 family)
MGYRHGFKTEANAIADETRRELGLGALDPLDPLALAAHLDVPVLALSELAADAPDVLYLLNVEPKSFSATTVFDGARRLIVHNDGHALARRNSNITHEISHALLLHEPKPALDHRGCRYWDQGAEDEANWLAGALLVPADAALAVARGWRSEQEAMEHFGVSEQMLEWRLNATGARKRVQRARSMRFAGPRR